MIQVMLRSIVARDSNQSARQPAPQIIAAHPTAPGIELRLRGKSASLATGLFRSVDTD